MRSINHDEVASTSDKIFGQAAVGMTHKLQVVGSIPALSTPVSLKFLPGWQLAAIAVAFAMLQRSRASGIPATEVQVVWVGTTNRTNRPPCACITRTLRMALGPGCCMAMARCVSLPKCQI